jgi:hypothetical protein
MLGVEVDAGGSARCELLGLMPGIELDAGG